MNPLPSPRLQHAPPILTPLLCLACLLGSVAAGAESPAVVLANPHFRYTIAADGVNREFRDRVSDRDYLKADPPTPCARVRHQGRELPVSRVAQAGDRLHLEFAETGIAVELRVSTSDAAVVLSVESVSGEPESLTFLNVPLTLAGSPSDAFGACALSLNLPTRVDALPALQRELRATAYARFGLVGAKVAIVAAPVPNMLESLRQVLAAADEMPHCPVAGPWADEIPFNHGSYLFNFGALTETNVDEWIAMARDLGVQQIDHHGGPAFFRFGDFELNRAEWPDGWQTFGRIVQRLRAAGISSIFHTYAFFIDKQSRYVTPVPDRRLAAFRTFTLAAPVGEAEDELRVNESTRDIRTVTGFFEHNSVVLHLGDELVTFSAAASEPPWRFTGVQRGALATRAAAHPAGTPARHLKECFGLFVPEPDSPLFDEIARNHARLVNSAGFAGIYLDAIDGSSILRGPDEAGYWADKFVLEIQRHLQPPVGMEMSAMWHHFWQYRTRWQAWDYPQRGHKRFIDLHAAAVHGGLLLPLHLGWWNFQSFNPPQVEPTYPDVIEYLGAKLIGWNAGISLTGAIDPQRLQSVPLFRRAVDTLRTCEQLRHQQAFNETVRARLREPGQDFALRQDAHRGWHWRPAQYTPHTVAAAEPWTLEWEIDNPHPEQPLQLRLEALMSAGPYRDTNNILLVDWSQTARAFDAPPQTAAGVTAQLGPDPATGGGRLAARSSGQPPRNAAWVRLHRQFNPPLNLSRQQALGFWIEGDGQGALLAIRLDSPRHLSFGALADRYLKIDFTGRRFITLIETESSRWSDYTWNDGKWLYNAYRETIDFGTVESVSLWLNDLPPNQEVACVIGPVEALPMLAGTLNHPTLTVNAHPVTFPVEIHSGAFIELATDGRCTLHGRDGELLTEVQLTNRVPTLRSGRNLLRFDCPAIPGPPPRARVVVITHGNPL